MVERAVAKISSGAMLAISDFIMGVAAPERLIDETVRQGKCDLMVITNDTTLPGSCSGKLIGARLGRCAREWLPYRAQS